MGVSRRVLLPPSWRGTGTWLSPRWQLPVATSPGGPQLTVSSLAGGESAGGSGFTGRSSQLTSPGPPSRARTGFRHKQPTKARKERGGRDGRMDVCPSSPTSSLRSPGHAGAAVRVLGAVGEGDAGWGEHGPPGKAWGVTPWGAEQGPSPAVCPSVPVSSWDSPPSGSVQGGITRCGTGIRGPFPGMCPAGSPTPNTALPTRGGSPIPFPPTLHTHGGCPPAAPPGLIPLPVPIPACCRGMETGVPVCLGPGAVPRGRASPPSWRRAEPSPHSR